MLDSAPASPAIDPLIACPDCEAGLCTETERLGCPDVGSGRRVRCTSCRGTGVRPCEVCRDADATRIRDGQPVCDGCAAECDEADAAALAASEACWNGCGAAPVAMAAGRPLCGSCLDDVRRLSAAQTIPAPPDTERAPFVALVQADPDATAMLPDLAANANGGR